MKNDLNNCVCIVTGASRGIGRSIAVALGKEGAIVYITARTLKSDNSDDSLAHTADLIKINGGKPISVALDHSDDTQVFGLFSRVRREQSGRLDILVNCAFSGSKYLVNNCKPDSVYWEALESPATEWDQINRVGLRNTYICSVLGTKMMLKCRESVTTDGTKQNVLPTGLIIHISNMGGQSMRTFNVAFCAGKTGLDRISHEMARDLKSRQGQVSVLSIIPGLIQTDACKSTGGAVRMFGQQVNLSMAAPQSAIGDVIVALARESSKELHKQSGKILSICDLTSKYGIRLAKGQYSPTGGWWSIKMFLQVFGWFKVSMLVPRFIKLPYWLIAVHASKY